MERIQFNTPFIIDGTVGVRLRVKKVTISYEEVGTLLNQILDLLKEPYNANEEPLIDIPCKVNGTKNFSYQLGFAKISDKLALYIKRKNGIMSDKSAYLTIKMNENPFTVREKKMIKDFIERKISSLIEEGAWRDAIETPTRYQTY